MEVAMQHDMETRIRERAYQLWQASGCEQGPADRYWLAAEREVLSASVPPSSARADKPVSAKGISAAAKSRRRAA
ncbi:MAG: DUF2934 domain-containing protein [Xanthobacteraceae bacterium]